MTEISMEFKESSTGPKGKSSKMFKDLNENVEWEFSGSYVFVTNPGRIQTGWVSKYLMKARLSLQFIQTPPASVTAFASTKIQSMTVLPWVTVTELQDF